MMPEMDGLELATVLCEEAAQRRLRRGDRSDPPGGRALPLIPVIGLTGNVEPAELEKCRRAGMTRVLSKPIDMAALFQAISDATQIGRNSAGPGDLASSLPSLSSSPSPSLRAERGGSETWDLGGWEEVDIDPGTDGCIFIPQLGDVGYEFRAVYCPTDGTAETVASTPTRPTLPWPPGAGTLPLRPALPPPPARALHSAAAGVAASSSVLTVASYNVLAEIYTNGMYSYCRHLAWHYRKQNLLSEVLGGGLDGAQVGGQSGAPTVLCLQEVQADHYEEWWLPQLAAAGYVGHFAVKTRVAMGAAGKMDGVATFFRPDRLELVHSASDDGNG
eukprot:SAG22_NODE_914_length_6519_cov_1.701713_9_plen_331_part_01